MILGCIVLALLTCRPRRIAYDHPDARILLLHALLGVLRKNVRDQVWTVLHFECVRQDDPWEALVFVRPYGGVIGRFNVDRRDVVRQQHDLIGVDFRRVLFR